MNKGSVNKDRKEKAEKGRDSRNFSAFFDKKIRQYVLDHDLIPEGTHIICGVSGGADSTALLFALCHLREEIPFTLEVIHVEHGIRGGESRADAAFTRDLCSRLGVTCAVIPADVPHFAEEEGLGLEEAARILRYRIFKEHAAEQTGSRIALAHHMEDNAETILFQMARGSGLSGLCGISPIRQDPDGTIYIRPLLHMQRKEIEDYLKEEGQSWCTDSTNADDAYSRNRIRHRILPELTALNNNAVTHINQGAAQLCEVQDFLRQQMREIYPHVVSRTEEKTEICISQLQKYHIALQKEILLEALGSICGKRKDLTSLHIDQLLGLMQGNSGHYISLPYEVKAEKSFDRLILSRQSRETDRTPGSRILLRHFPFDGNLQKIPKNKYTKWFDYDKIKNGLSVRSRQSGDYLIIDREGHRKKLKAYLIEQKIPENQRDQVLLLASESEILWVVGYRTGSGALVDESTREILEAVSIPEGSLNGF